MRLGAHLSTAGGWHRAVEQGEELGCTCLQLFLRPPGRWAAPRFPERNFATFRAAAESARSRGAIFAHAPYLINIASPDPALAQRSLTALGEELRWAQELGLAGVVVHPGSAGKEVRAHALPRVRAALGQLLEENPVAVPLILENAAGAGNLLGVTVTELVSLVDSQWVQRGRVAFCLDTAHLWAAGYQLLRGGWAQALEELAPVGGAATLALVHLNDTPVACGSRKDRHVPPGDGQLGLGFFAELLADRTYEDLCGILEIPPGRGNQLVRQALHRLQGLQRP
ncbi:MAG: deoxyribonuclease IV [Thermoanaerobaculum sp.]|nr:deoxyribonuclease IV [Thermoanaerobaculum sp.]MDW7968137.1 deoxyribonuclease IV [Thermoanaerobaculum sp.]